MACDTRNPIGMAAKFLASISGIFLPKPATPGNASITEAYKKRCNSFRMLISANNRALLIMNEIEEAIGGTRPFGMNYVKARLTEVTTAVYQIIRYLNELSDNRYPQLITTFDAIRKEIEAQVTPKASNRTGVLTLPIGKIDGSFADETGQKMAILGEISNHFGIDVPAGFVITASAYDRFVRANDLQPEIDGRIQTADGERLDSLYALSSCLQDLIIKATVPPDLAQAILDQYGILEGEAGKGVGIAMRSSALGEDLRENTFAGQYATHLNVCREDLISTYKEIVASKYGVTAMAYRLNRGIRDEDVAMCVGCMVMVDAVAGGVAYSRDPVNPHNDVIMIHSVPGLPKAVVDGIANADMFLVSRQSHSQIIAKKIAEKKSMYVNDGGDGIRRLPVPPDLANKPSLMDNDVHALAALADKLERHYGNPQDIEWALDRQGKIILLQARPLSLITIPETSNYRAIAGTSEVACIGSGVTVSPGVAAGRICVVQKDADALQFPSGAVLVIPHAEPRWAPLLAKASGVIAETGSIAGHLANVAREFKVVAVFEVNEAVKKLANADIVTIDGKRGLIFPGFVEGLTFGRDEPRNIMQGSPVHTALKLAARHIVPLRLLDPDSVDFRPGNCKTLHDITRFCHENAVKEMYSREDKPRIPDAFSKQLRIGRPVSYWIIDLDDGLKKTAEGKYVDLADVVSIPMLALWAGITACPWDGPPNIDTRGFLTILAQSTANPALDPAVQTTFDARNYFLISKYYCCLQSRFGYHFCTVEAWTGEDPVDNYVSFQFKGGAADLERRIARAKFIAYLIEPYGFRVETKQDGLFARIEERSLADTLLCLKITGYLLIHTRQLDMVMKNPAATKYWHEKISRDLQAMSAMTAQPG